MLETVGCQQTATFKAKETAHRPSRRLHPDHRGEAGGAGAQSHHLHDNLQRPVPRAAAALQRRPAVTIDIHNRDRHARATALAWAVRFHRCRWRREEGTPFIPAHGSRRITFAPKPSGLRFYHTHVHAGANLNAGQYTGQVGPVYIEPKNNPGQLRSRGFPHAEGIRTDLQPRRRHGDGLSVARGDRKRR